MEYEILDRLIKTVFDGKENHKNDLHNYLKLKIFYTVN